ncbi:MAG: SDR family oxidoreductase [Bacteroidia bacterium]
MPTALVTGASRGIGYALCQHLLEKNFSVVGLARKISSLEALQKVHPHQLLPVQADVTDYDSCAQAVEKAVQTFGGIDWLINNAGISMRALLTHTEIATLRQVMEVNFWGTVHCTKAALPYLVKRKGLIIGISSIAGFRGLPARTAYSASKFAMQGFLEALRVELLPTGVDVLIVGLGFVRTDIRAHALNAQGSPQGESPIDEKTFLSPETVAQQVFRAAQKRQPYLILPKKENLTLWLSRLFPRWTDKKVFAFFAKEKDSPLSQLGQL